MEYVKVLNTEMKVSKGKLSAAIKKNAGQPHIELSNIYSESKGNAIIYMNMSNPTRGSIRDIVTTVAGEHFPGESYLDYKGFDGYKFGTVTKTEDGFKFEDNWGITKEGLDCVKVDVDTRDLVAHFEINLEAYIKDTLKIK